MSTYDIGWSFTSKRNGKAHWFEDSAVSVCGRAQLPWLATAGENEPPKDTEKCAACVKELARRSAQQVAR